MPIYEYECQNCRARSEAMQKFTDDPLTTCKVCGGELRKLISHTSFVLKGSGWYVTDYASGDRKKAMDSEKPSQDKGSTEAKAESKADGAKTETKAESKPETKAESKSDSSPA